MINPFSGHNPKVVEIAAPKQPVGDKPILNLNLSGSKLNMAR
jgi:hypothetical protein